MSVLHDLVRIGTRNVARNLRRSLLTGGMLAVGVAALVFFRGYIIGLREMMLSMVVNTITGPFQVERVGYSANKSIAPLDLELPIGGPLEAAIRRVPGVVGVAPRIRFGALLFNDDRSTIVGVLGVDPEQEKWVVPKGPGAGYQSPPREGVSDEGIQGTAIQRFDDDTIILGPQLAKGMGVELGDRITLLAQTRSGSTDAVEGVVRATFNSGDPELNKRMVVMSLGLAQKLLHMPGQATLFTVGAKSIREIPETANHVRRALGSLEPKTEVRTWDQLAPYYRDVVKLQDNVMDIVMGILVTLVLAGVINTMMMSVFERQREIGTLMAIGFRRYAILALFLIESLTLGALSALCGAGLGGAIIALTSHTGLPFTIPAVGTIVVRPAFDPTHVVLTASVAVLAAIAAGFFPAYRASRLRPVEALHVT